MKVVGKMFGGAESGQESGYLVHVSVKEWERLEPLLSQTTGYDYTFTFETAQAFSRFADAVKYAHRILNETQPTTSG